MNPIVVVCAGGAKGIGFACATCLGHEGCQVVVADIDEKGAQEAAHRLQSESIAASAFKCDVGNKAEVGAPRLVTPDRHQTLALQDQSAGL